MSGVLTNRALLLDEFFRLVNSDIEDDDMIAGPVCADAIMRELPDARLVTIPDSGHFVYVEQPEAFRAALTDFFL